MLVPASDGLPARESGPWALEKLQNLFRYCDIVSTSMKGKFSGGVMFVDLMAGAGHCVDTKTPGCQEFPGSTIVALSTKYPFQRVIAIEAHPDCVTALRTRVQRHHRSALCEVIEGDCNTPEVVASLRQATVGALGVVFVDLLGTEVSMNTLRSLTSDRAMDLIFTWPEMDLVRNRGMMLEQADRWNDFFGTTQWQDIVSATGPTVRLRALQRLYLRQLEDFGFRYTGFLGSVKNRRGRVLYRPLLASRHPLAESFWQKAAAPMTPRLFDW